MKELIQLSSSTIDLADVYEIYDLPDHVLIVFGGSHKPFDMKLIGEDANILRNFLDEQWQKNLTEMQDGGRYLIKPEYHQRPYPNKEVEDRTDIPF